MNKHLLNLLFGIVLTFAFLPMCIAQSSNCSHPDYPTLKILYNATDGANWNNKWDLSDCNICDWSGVSCNEEKRVIAILLGGNNLKGNLPNEISNLTNLQRLLLNHNQLNGRIPTSLQFLTNLRQIKLNQNRLTGTIPFELGEIESLGLIDLSQNELTGSIPSSLGKLKNLITLNLSFNKLTGRIPKELAQIPVKTLPVMSLQLNDNNLSDCYYRELKKLCGVFDILRLHNNPGLPDGGGIFPQNSLCQGIGGEEILCKTTTNCDNLRFSINPYELTVNGLVVTSTVTFFGEHTNWEDKILAGCFRTVCGDSVIIKNLVPGEYLVKIQQSPTDGSFCYLEKTIIIPDSMEIPPIEQPTNCDQLSFSTNENQIIVDGLSGNYNKVEILGKNTDWKTLPVCDGDCPPTLAIPDLASGEYAVKVNQSGNDGSSCYREEKVTVTTGSNNDTGTANCNGLSFSTNNDTIILEGLTANYDKVEIIGQNTSWQVVTICDGDCEEIQRVPDLAAGEYVVKINQGGNDGTYCYREEKIVVTNGNTNRNSIIDYNNELVLYPNPVRDRINLKFHRLTEREGTIHIYNAFGQTVQSFPKTQFINDGVSIDLNGFENGIYLLSVKVDGLHMITKRFVFENLR